MPSPKTPPAPPTLITSRHLSAILDVAYTKPKKGQPKFSPYKAAQAARKLGYKFKAAGFSKFWFASVKAAEDAAKARRSP
jgi:hypothetical protein